MNCRDMDHALVEIEGAVSAQLPPQAEAHLRGCRRCQELVRTLNLSIGPESPSPTALHQIERAIVADLHPVRPLAPSRYFFAAFAAVFVLTVAIAGYRMGAFALAAMSPLQTVAILCSLAASAGLLARSLIHQMVPGSRYKISPSLLPVLVLIALTLVMALLFRFQYEREFWAQAWPCLKAGTAIGLFAAVPFWLLLRRGAVLSPAVTGAATGALAGLVGTSALEIHCPNLDAWHILVSHLGVALLGAMAGLITGVAVEIISRRSYHH